MPVDRLYPREEAEQRVAQMQQAAQEAAPIDSNLTQAKTQKEAAAATKTSAEAEVIQASAGAVVQEIMSRIEQNMGKTKSEADRVQLESLRTLLQAAEGTSE